MVCSLIRCSAPDFQAGARMCDQFACVVFSESGVSSPTTLRSHQKDVISQLLHNPHDAAEVNITEPGDEAASDGAAGSDHDVLSKPNLATQLVLGCYVATQKATGVPRSYLLDGNLQVLASGEHGIKERQCLVGVQAGLNHG